MSGRKGGVKSVGSRLFQSELSCGGRLITLSWSPHAVTAGTGQQQDREECRGPQARYHQELVGYPVTMTPLEKKRDGRKTKKSSLHHSTQQIVSQSLVCLLSPPLYHETMSHISIYWDRTLGH